MSHVSATTSLWVIAAIGCGGAHAGVVATRPTRPTIAPETRALAPDLAARVDRAELDGQQAADGGDDQATADHRRRAQLWQVAAEAEAQRIVFEREREQVLREVEALETARVANESERSALEREIKREQAAAIARAEASRVLNEAEVDEARRRGGDPARVESRREASRALVDRSTAVLAAAAALGANESTVAAAQRALDQARRKVDGSAASMQLAQTAFAGAQRALGQARAQRPGPDALEHNALIEALRDGGWTAEPTDDGLVIWLVDYFSGNQKTLRPGAKTLVSTLGHLLAAHPHGPIQIQVAVTTTVSSALARERAQQLKTALDPAGADRLAVVTGARTNEAGSSARVVLPAY